MPAGKGYRGSHGQSGVEPESMDSDSGAYGYSARRMGPPMTQNIQTLTPNTGGPKRDAAVTRQRDAHSGNSGGGGGGGY